MAFAREVDRLQQDAIEYLKEENRVLREQLGGRRLRLTDAQRRRLAAKVRTLGRDGLKEIADLVTPDTSLRWHKTLIAKKSGARAAVWLPFIHPGATLLIFLEERRQYRGMIWSFLCWLASALKTRRSLALENLALRHQLVILQRSVKRPRLSSVDRGFWVWLRRVWTDWDGVSIGFLP